MQRGKKPECTKDHLLYGLNEDLDILCSTWVLRRCPDALIHRAHTLVDGVRRNVRLEPSTDNQ